MTREGTYRGVLREGERTPVLTHTGGWYGAAGAGDCVWLIDGAEVARSRYESHGALGGWVLRWSVEPPYPVRGWPNVSLETHAAAICDAFRARKGW